jgi:tRNA(fMet)-specific endonuclease VapC
LKFVLDTNVCIGLINRTEPRLSRKLLEQGPEDVGVSMISVAELQFGAEKSKKREEAVAKIQLLLGAIRAIPFDLPAVEAYGKIRADLSNRGLPIGPLDTLIAGHALSLAATLVTNNTREFKRVRGLQVADWSK